MDKHFRVKYAFRYSIVVWTKSRMDIKNASDPFFSVSGDGDWIACIGRQGDEEDYVEGYMQAALELASAVIDKGQYGKRDTLAMPILYNARHAVELTLKFTTKRLHDARVIAAHPPRRSHDIMVPWKLLYDANAGDHEFRKLVLRLQPFVDSLHRVDADGQQLRYSETRDGRQSLSNESVCDLEVIRASLEELDRVLSALRRRALRLIEERDTGTFTRVCSRADLFQIAMTLPQRDRWPTAEFDDAKRRVLHRFQISSTQFSKAVDMIKSHREMGSLVGYEFQLRSITDEHLLFVVEEWQKLHPRRTESEDPDVLSLDESVVARIVEYHDRKREVVAKVLATLSREELIDLVTIYNLGRDKAFCEYYERRLDRTMKQLSPETVTHVIAKTNLREALAVGVEILGRRALSVKLRG